MKTSKYKCIKSRERAVLYGEIFTPEHIVNDMLNMIDEETRKIESKFLDPACGNGNFLVEILRRKLRTVEEQYGKNQKEYERYTIIAVSSIYGIELLEDNVIECRERLFGVFKDSYTKIWKDEINQEIIDTIRYILLLNIVHGDTLAMKTAGDNPQPIVVSEWFFDDSGELRKRDFLFSELVNGETKQPVLCL
jgi:hypothetical protein